MISTISICKIVSIYFDIPLLLWSALMWHVSPTLLNYSKARPTRLYASRSSYKLLDSCNEEHRCRMAAHYHCHQGQGAEIMQAQLTRHEEKHMHTKWEMTDHSLLLLLLGVALSDRVEGNVFYLLCGFNVETIWHCMTHGSYVQNISEKSTVG